MDGSSSRALPEPEGGWRGVGTQALVVAALWALAIFTITAFLLPQMDPECYTDDTGSTVCPLPESRNPALAELLDVRWPPIGSWEVLALAGALAAIFVAVGVSLFLSTNNPWSRTGGAPDLVGLQAALGGVGLGLVVAGPGFVRPISAVACVALGLIAWLLAAVACRIFVRSLQRRYAEHLRRTRLREHGRRLLADVVDVAYLPAAGTTGGSVFRVEARPRGGGRSLVGLLQVPRPDAPVVGGTVFVYSDGAHAHPTGVDVVMDPDPESIRDAHYDERYPEPSPY